MRKLTILSLIILLLATASLAQRSAGAAASPTRQPKTVRDFFMALPDKYMGFDCCYHLPARQRKAEYLKRYLITEDTANGYMNAAGDGAQQGFEMALFKRPNGTYLIGFYTYGEGGLEDTPWIVFLDYANGRWTDVSRRVIPGYDPVKLEYKLPQHGTTVRVFTKQEEGDPPHLYNLVWKNGKFTRSNKSSE